MKIENGAQHFEYIHNLTLAAVTCQMPPRNLKSVMSRKRKFNKQWKN